MFLCVVLCESSLQLKHVHQLWKTEFPGNFKSTNEACFANFWAFLYPSSPLFWQWGHFFHSVLLNLFRLSYPNVFCCYRTSFRVCRWVGLHCKEPRDECSDFSEQLANQDVMFGLEILGRSLNAFHAQSSTMEISKPEIFSLLDANRQGVTISLTVPLWDSWIWEAKRHYFLSLWL